jgi:hypothetical protein
MQDARKSGYIGEGKDALILQLTTITARWANGQINYMLHSKLDLLSITARWANGQINYMLHYKLDLPGLSRHSFQI